MRRSRGSQLSTPTQAIAIADVVRYLVETPGIQQTRSRTIQIGSAEVLTDPSGMALFDFPATIV